MSAGRGRGRPPLELDGPAVLRAALEAFADDGPTRTSMERVAARCGVAKTTLHDRFGSKSELFDAAVAQERARLRDHLLAGYAASEALDARAQIRAGYASLFTYARENPAGFRVLFGGLESGAQTLTQEGRAVVTRAVANLITGSSERAGVAVGRSAEILADMIVGSGEYVARRLASDPSLDVEAVTDLVASAVTSGVLASFPEPAARFDANA